MPDKYVGRIVAVGRTTDGRNVGMYRVSSRSVPNREIVEGKNSKLFVKPKPGFEKEAEDNPFVTYCAMRTAGDYMVVSNGIHTDLIADSITMGMQPKQALGLSLALMDHERDSFQTPRIAAVVPSGASDTAFLGMVSNVELTVTSIILEAGVCRYVATYEMKEPGCQSVFPATTSEAIASYLVDDPIIFSHFTHPVASAAAVFENGEWKFSTHQVV